MTSKALMGDRRLKNSLNNGLLTPSLVFKKFLLPLFFWAILIGAAAASQPHFYTPATLTYDKLLNLSADQLDKANVAEMDLLCAKELPGAENLDVGKCLEMIDAWTTTVKDETDRYLYMYKGNPSQFKNMEGYYRMQMLVTVVKQDLGVHYDARRSNDEPGGQFFRDSSDLFIHGLLSVRRAGTCCSIPVLLTSVARELGYPVKLVGTSVHLFARWDDGVNRFNIEATNGGMTSHPDDYYRQWPRPVTDQQIADEGYLRSMSGKEVLANFLFTRAACLSVNGRKPEAKLVCLKASQLVPSSKVFKKAAENL